MNSPLLIKDFDKMKSALDNFHPEDWEDIELFLNRIKKSKKPVIIPSKGEALQCFARGTAFLTFSYGIDGVSIEISKYGHTRFKLFKEFEEVIDSLYWRKYWITSGVINAMRMCI